MRGYKNVHVTVYLESDIKRIFAGKRVLIAGLGREGRSAKALLEALGVCSQLEAAGDNTEIGLKLCEGGWDMIIKSPGIPMRSIEELSGDAEISSMTDIFLRVYGQQTVGITGTKGKSTTTTLIHEVLKAGGYNVLLGGNIGIPLFELVERMDASTIVVAELSCHQLEGIYSGPHVGVLLNLFEEHLDHYESYEGYKMAKMQIGLRQGEGDTFIYCGDNEELAKTVAAHRREFHSEVTAYSVEEAPIYGGVKPRLKGEHNRSNIEAAAHVAQLYCVDGDVFRKTVEEFRGLEHRLEYVGMSEGVKFYNDSISTIPAATEAAVAAIGEVETLIVGGFDRGIDYNGLADYLTASRIKNIAFVGEAGRRVCERTALLGGLENKRYIKEDDYRRIVDWCFEVTEEGGVCLLSPAAASYDGFANFEERGRVFKQLVRTHVRHQLNAHPGLSGEEAYAHDMVTKCLRAYAECKVNEHVGGYGVVAVFGDRAELPTIAFRADTDALPIGGVSHRCGHDGHTAILLRVADLISQDRELYSKCNIMLIFQPEEETGKGAQKILESGIMQRYDIKAVYGLHNIPGEPIGRVVSSIDTFAAASVGLKYRLCGRQTHASTPEKGINPGLAVAEIINRFATYAGGKTTLEEFSQSTLIGVRVGEEAYGTSAGEGEVMFTLRALTNKRMEQLRKEADEIVAEVSVREGLSWTVEEHDRFNATENNAELAEELERTLRAGGYEVKRMEKPFRWSEDFANYLMSYPGVFFGIGSGEGCHELHHPEYDFPDELTEPAAEAMMLVVSRFAAQSSKN